MPNSSPIRIVHIIDSLNIGGTEKQCVELVKRLNDFDYDISLITLDKNGYLFDCLGSLKKRTFQTMFPRGFYHFTFFFKLLKLAKLIKRLKPDIVQTYGFYSAVPGILASKIAGVPIVIAGKRDMSEFLSSRQLKVETALWRIANIIIVNAHNIRRQLVQNFRVCKDKVATIHNGVDTNFFTPLSVTHKLRSEKLQIGMIASFRDQKDHKTFLEAAKVVLQIRSNILFVLIGSGPREMEMKNYTCELGIEDSVFFCGRRTGDQLVQSVRDLYISVLPSFNEGFPNAILESMACGVPVIANPSGGVEELIDDGITGYLFPYKRPDILAEKILFLLDNTEVGTHIAANARHKVESQFNFDIICGKYQKLYQNLVHQNVFIKSPRS